MPQDSGKQIQNLQYIKYNPAMVNSYNAMLNQHAAEQHDNDKLDKFKIRLKQFENVSTLEAAKDLMTKVMPVTLERTVFYIGDAKCTIINRHNLLRISLRTQSEFITYNFV